MSSPPQQLSFSGFPNLTSSPMKGFSFYFDQDNVDSQGQHNQHTSEYHFQDENIAPMPLHFGSDLEEVVPVSQHNGVPLAPVSQNNHMFSQYLPQQSLQMPLKFDMSQAQHNFIANHQMPPPQQTSLPQLDEQKNLYPAMHVFKHSQSVSNIPQSASMNTLTSYDSAPGLTISHSASDNSLSMSPVSFQNANQTPRRLTNRRPSTAITPLPQISQSPRTNEYLSPVATRSQSHSSISTQTPTAKLMRHRRTRSRLSLDLAGASNRSPSGTNPFYTAFLSPHQHSPSATPLQTPHRNAISPNVLVNQGGITPFTHSDQSTATVATAAADYTLKMAPELEDSAPPQFSFQKLSQDSKPLARSQSSIDLAAIAGVKSAPTGVQCFDILEPRRKKVTKMSSMTLPEDSSKKVHDCPLCGSRFQRPEHVKRHMRSHSSEKPFFCDEEGCGKRFNRADNMKAHLRKIHKRQV